MRVMKSKFETATWGGAKVSTLLRYLVSFSRVSEASCTHSASTCRRYIGVIWEIFSFVCVFEIAQLNKKKLSDFVINWNFAGLVSGGTARLPQWTGEALGIHLGFPALLPWALGWGRGQRRDGGQMSIVWS